MSNIISIHKLSKLIFSSHGSESFSSWNYSINPARALYFYGFDATWVDISDMVDDFDSTSESFYIFENYECFSQAIRKCGYIKNAFFYSESDDPMGIMDRMHSNIASPINSHNFYHRIVGTQILVTDDYVYDTCLIGTSTEIQSQDCDLHITDCDLHADKIMLLGSTKNIHVGNIADRQLYRALVDTCTSFGANVTMDSTNDELSLMKCYNPMDINAYENLFLKIGERL